jgi:hypothetical protein
VRLSLDHSGAPPTEQSHGTEVAVPTRLRSGLPTVRDPAAMCTQQAAKFVAHFAARIKRERTPRLGLAANSDGTCRSHGWWIGVHELGHWAGVDGAPQRLMSTWVGGSAS